MTTVLVIFHVLVSLVLIFIVLIQGGKGAELGAAFGAGSSQTLFGGRGAATLLNKMTTVVAVIFMLTSLLLAIASVRSTSIIKESAPVEQKATQGPLKTPPAPAQPEKAPLSPGAPAQAR
jgi:preprotein translocase subunit SecG